MDGECLVLLVGSDLEVKLLACVKDRGFGQRRVSDFIEGIGRAFTGHGWFQGLSAAEDKGGRSSLMMVAVREEHCRVVKISRKLIEIPQNIYTRFI